MLSSMSDHATTRILEGPLARELARFGTPLAVGMALQTTFNLVDAYLIGQLPPNEVGPAVGALGICDQVAAIGTILSYGVSTATSTVLSNQNGAGDTEGIKRTAWQSILIVLALGVIFALLGLVFSGVIVRDLIGAKGAVAEVATRYLRVIVGGSFSIFFLLQLTSIQRALGSAKTPVALLVSGNVLNVLLAIVFIFGPGPAPPAFAWATAIARALHVPHMGMIGAAWATILARSVTLVPIVVILARRFEIVRPPPGERGPERAEIERIMSIAWPSSAQFVIRIAAMLLANSLVARFFTTPTDQTATTGMGLVFRLDTMALFVAMGWGSAAQTFVGQNLGAKNEGRATQSGWVTAAYDAITNVGLVALVFFCGARILRVFDDDPAPVAIAMSYLRVVAPSYIGLGIGVVLGNAMAGAGATRTTMWVDIAVILGFQFPLCIGAVVLGGVPIHTLFECVAATNVMSAFAYGAVYARGSWRAAHVRAASPAA
jgi:putative MATE family efflux protein